MISEVETGEASTKKKTRGPNSGKALTAEVERRGKLNLVTPGGRVDSDTGGEVLLTRGRSY